MERKIDVEKVSKGLECCRNRNTGCDNCPYRVLESASCIIQLLNESFSAVKQLSEQVEELTDKHWQKCGQISQYANGVPVNLPCEVGTTVYVSVRKKIRDMEIYVPQIEKGVVECFDIGRAGILIVKILLDSGERCLVCGSESFYFTLEEAQEAECKIRKALEKGDVIIVALNKDKGLAQAKKIIANEGLVVLSKNIGNGTIKTNLGRFKVVYPDGKILGLRPSAVYVDSDIPFDVFQNYVEPITLINNSQVEYF